MQESTLVKLWGLSCLIIGYFIAASHGYDGWLFTTVMAIIAAAMGLEVGIKRGVNGEAWRQSFDEGP